MKWERVVLGDYIDILSGFPFESKLFSESEGTPLIRIRDVVRGYTNTFYNGNFENSYLVKRGDILVGMDGEFNTAKWSSEPALLNQRVCKITSKDSTSLSEKYLFHLLPKKLKEIEDRTSFVTVKHLSVKNINAIEIDLPPLPIQQQIADTLDKADALRRKDQELLDKYDELAQAVFYEMFGDPVWNEKGWEIKSVIEMADCIVPGRDKPKSFTGKIPWITTEDLQHLNYTHKSKKGIGLTESEIKSARARKIPKNSIIMTCVGDLGVVSLAGFEMVVNQQLHTFQCKSINPIFLMFALSLQKNYMIKMASSTTLPYMNKTICNSIPIIAPPLKMQEVFSIFIKNLNSQIEKVKIGLELSNNLIKTQTNRCFNGS